MSLRRDVEITAFAVDVLRRMGHHPAYLRITVGEKPYIVLPGDEEACLDLCRFFGTHRIRGQKYELHSLGCRILFSPSIPPANSPDLDGQLDELREFIDDAELVEITPKSIRIRKRFLSEHERRRAQRSEGS